MIFIGIDPGLDGAIALHDSSDGSVCVTPMPVIARSLAKNRKRGERPKLAVDIAGVFNLVQVFRMLGPALWVLEKIEGRAFPSVGISLGRSAAIPECALQQAGVPYYLARPLEWKAHFGLLKQGKGASISKASEIFSSAAHLWPRQCDDGLAEAALLARYARHLYETGHKCAPR